MQWGNQAFWRPGLLRTEIMSFIKSQSFIEPSVTLIYNSKLGEGKKSIFARLK
jgi:hypothetical protein